MFISSLVRFSNVYSLAWWQSLLHLLVQPLMLVDNQGHMIDANAAASTLLGKAAPRLLDCAWPSPSEAPAEGCPETGNGGHFFMPTHPITVLPGDGRSQPVTGLVVPLGKEAGYLVILQPSGQETTALKQAEQALRDREHELEVFFTQSLNGFFFMMLDQPIQWDDTIDREAALDYVFAHQRVTKCNQAILEQYGFAESEFLGLTPADFFTHDLEAGRAVWRNFFDQGRLQTETQERKADGSLMWIEGDYVCLYDHQGRITGHLGVQREVTELKVAIAALEASENNYRLLVENQTDLVVKTDADGHFLFVSPSYCDLFDQSPQALLGQQFMPLVQAEDRPLTAQALAALGQPPHTAEIEQRALTRLGWRWLAWSNQAILDDGGNVVSIVGVGRDITDRKRHETSIYELSQRLSLVTRSAQLGVWDLDLSTGQLLWDARMYKIYGLAPGDPQPDYENWLTRVHPDDIEAVQAVWQALHRGGENTHTEFRIICPSGETRYIEAHTIAKRDPKGQIQRLTGINRDITDRKRDEMTLQNTSQRLMLATKAAQMGIWEWQLEGNRLVWDERMHEIFGVPLDAFTGTYRDCEDRVHPEDLPHYYARRDEALASGNLAKFEFRIVRLNGEVRHIESCFNVIRDAAGQPIRIIGINRDISDRKQSELALANAHHQLQALMQNAPAIMGLFDETGRYQRVNPSTVNLLGLPESEIVGRRFDEIHRPEMAAGFMAQIQQVMASDRPVTVEEHLVNASGEERILRTVLFPVLKPPGQPQILGLVSTDITPLVTAQETLQRQATRERLLREISGNIRSSLDLNSILDNAVTGIRQFLNADRVVVYRFNADWGGDMIVESVITPWTAVLGETLRDPCFAEQWIEPYRQGRISQVTDVLTADITPCHRKLLTHYQIRANLVVPLVVENSLWGLLCIHHCQGPHPWQPEEVAFVQQLADQVEIAIQQARLLRETTARAQREQLLNEIVTLMRGSLDLSTIIERTTQKLRAEFQVGRCLFIRCNQDDDYFEYNTCALAPDMLDLTGLRLPLQDSPYIMSILSQASPKATCDMMAESTVANLRSFAQAFRIGAALSAAIRDQAEVKGILCVHHATPRQWTEHEQILIQQVADQLAIAIQQAELYQQAQAEIAERMRLEEQLRHDAFHDALTGLPNRALLLDRLQLAIQRYQRSHYALNAQPHPPTAIHSEFAVLFLDLDRFKVINDSLGHSCGDQLLKVVANRLTTCLREVDIAARLGGDEFVILLEDLTDLQYVIEITQRIHAVLEKSVMLADQDIFVHASIGIAMGSIIASTPEQMLRNADIAMYEAKKNNQEYVVFDASMHAIALTRMTLENDLCHAIKRNELSLFYQPIVSLKTGKISGFEALVRWQHPTRGLLFPVDFIDVAEETGLIAAIDLWVLQESCQALRRWHEIAPDLADVTMSVNLSGKQFSQPNLIQQIDHALRCANLTGKHLKLEITESVLIKNNSLAINLLNEFRARNIQVCMDDFGTGYSSLSYLHQFPVDVLKIDKSFILNLSVDHTSSRDHKIVQAIITLALNLNLQVIAEGIEHEGVRACLQAHHCQFGQGYHFSPAIAFDAATQLLIDQPFQSSARFCHEG
ncbi:EAL domain-containing protein [Nodosilinea sp. LEGE 07088]|uniref:EAL domain-containing protein n=1 Tax=Nodosilinea sp. LEGE 07088 TaxID=2777968 RepID=UPI001882277C|nr:EAL domain-containing protein [Nodosilinea sp. LEGE 07088]MBE9136640.1 EAL domain-containing protein [Nodosilinea sp. LEGE 07088]